MLPIVLKTQRIILRPLIAGDTQSLVFYANDQSISEVTTLPYPYTECHARTFIRDSRQEMRKKTDFALGIEWHKTRKVIGMMSLHNVGKDGPQAEIGYWVGKPYRGRGIASEALELVVQKLAFQTLKLQRVYAVVYYGNAASEQLLLQRGFEHEGYRVYRNIRNNEWRSVNFFGKWNPSPRDS